MPCSRKTSNQIKHGFLGVSWKCKNAISEKTAAYTSGNSLESCSGYVKMVSAINKSRSLIISFFSPMHSSSSNGNNLFIDLSIEL